MYNKVKIIDHKNKFYNKILEFVACSPLDKWGAIIARTDKGGNSTVFREGEYKFLKSK